MKAEVDDAVITSLLAAISLCTLEAMRMCVPEHTKKARSIRKIEEAIKEFSKLHRAPLNEEEFKIGVKLHCSNVEFILHRLTDEYAAVREGRQLVLFDGEYGRNKRDESVLIDVRYTVI